MSGLRFGIVGESVRPGRAWLELNALGTFILTDRRQAGTDELIRERPTRPDRDHQRPLRPNASATRLTSSSSVMAASTSMTGRPG